MKPSKPIKSTVKLGKSDVELHYTFPAFDRMNREYGVNAMRPSTFISLDPSAGATLVWGGQLHTKKPLTRDQVVKLMPTDTEEYAAMMEVVAMQLNRALGDKTDEAT